MRKGGAREREREKEREKVSKINKTSSQYYVLCFCKLTTVTCVAHTAKIMQLCLRKKSLNFLSKTKVRVSKSLGFDYLIIIKWTKYVRKKKDEIYVTIPWTFEKSEHLHEKRKSTLPRTRFRFIYLTDKTTSNQANKMVLNGQINIRPIKQDGCLKA